MAYNPEDDKVLKEFEPIYLKEGESIYVRVVAYKGGEPKVAFLHAYSNRDGEPRTSKKIPRLVGECAEKVATTMAEAAKFAMNPEAE